VVAFLYASVGHGGASGYLALMALMGISPVLMQPSALMLNIVVSAISFTMYYRGGHFLLKKLLPFILLSVPMAFIGPQIKIEPHTYKIILGICLVIATLRLIGVFGNTKNEALKKISFVPALIIGGVIGLISGMIGIGGGIILSPVLLLLQWADLKQTAAISAAFIFVNSVAGMAGHTISQQTITPDIFKWAIAAIIGGIAGAYLGSGKFNFKVLRYILSGVLLFASYHLILK
jgi:uncharacterized protein